MRDIKHNIPVWGAVQTLNFTQVTPDEAAPYLLVKTWSSSRRFAVKVEDDGMYSFGLRIGSYAVFKETRWPDHECAVCLVAIGEEYSIRILEGLYDTEVTLRAAGDAVPPLRLMNNEFVVMGVLSEVVWDAFAEFEHQTELEFDWGC